MTDDELKARFEAMRQENAATADRIELLAESVIQTGEMLRNEIADLRD